MWRNPSNFCREFATVGSFDAGDVKFEGFWARLRKKSGVFGAWWSRMVEEEMNEKRQRRERERECRGAVWRKKKVENVVDSVPNYRRIEMTISWITRPYFGGRSTPWIHCSDHQSSGKTFEFFSEFAMVGLFNAGDVKFEDFWAGLRQKSGVLGAWRSRMMEEEMREKR